jgi:hypothetical protein
MFHGSGSLIYKKMKYSGSWVEGKRHGYGLNVYENGDIYEG